jgi:phenylacetate-CoA ligase
MSNIILSRLRRSTFWSLDRFRGRPVRTAYDEIATIDGLDSDDPVVKNHQENRLTKIIEHAVTTTDFYRQFSKNIPLERLPVVRFDPPTLENICLMFQLSHDCSFLRQPS